MYRNPTKSFAIWDTVLFDFMRRDELVALAAGAWDYVKNSGNFNAKNWDLDFLGFLPGKRESRRMCGEYMITQRDVSDNRVFDDEIAFGGWPLDDHFPDGFYHRGTPNTDIQTPASYSIPYRSLLPREYDNMLVAGRCLSATHEAQAAVRVMPICCCMGEAAGRAAALAHKGNTSVREISVSELQRQLGL